MAKGGTNDFSSPQEAIEGYLEALLQDVADYDDDFDKPVTEPVIEKPSYSRKYQTVSNAVQDVAPKAELQTKSVEDRFERVDFAYQETPAVVMPELRFAESEPEVVELTAIAEPEVVVAEPEVVVDEPEVTTVVPEVETVEVHSVEVEDVGETAVDVAVELAPEQNEGWTDGKPNWAQGRFECLLFVVKGLKLAVPLAELGGIHKLEKEPTPLFGQPSWFLGIIRANARNVGLVDTAQWVMPERIREDHEPDFRFAIRIHNSDWGLACNEVAEAISLHPDEVKWRTSLGRRPWLAGTVVDHMCALIDVAAFARLLDSDKVPVNLQELAAASDD